MGGMASGNTRRDWLAFDHRDNLAPTIVPLITVSSFILFGLARFVVDAAATTPHACVLLKMSSTPLPLLLMLVTALLGAALRPGTFLRHDVQGLV
jgi:hypothetical protein